MSACGDQYAGLLQMAKHSGMQGLPDAEADS